MEEEAVVVVVEEEERCRVTVVVGLVLVVENCSVGGYSWHIGAARRPLTSPCLPLPLSRPLPPPFYPASRHLSPSHLSIPPLFPPISPRSLFLHRGPPSPFPRDSSLRDSSSSPLHRVNPYTHTQESTPPAAFSTLCLLVWFRSRSPLPLAIPPTTPLDVSLPSPPSSCSPPAAAPATLQPATTCIHPATKPSRLLRPTINETVH